jgi:hypothetical protein
MALDAAPSPGSLDHAPSSVKGDRHFITVAEPHNSATLTAFCEVMGVVLGEATETVAGWMESAIKQAEKRHF